MTDAELLDIKDDAECAAYSCSAAGGCLHCVIEDLNLEDRHLDSTINDAGTCAFCLKAVKRLHSIPEATRFLIFGYTHRCSDCHTCTGYLPEYVNEFRGNTSWDLPRPVKDSNKAAWELSDDGGFKCERYQEWQERPDLSKPETLRSKLCNGRALPLVEDWRRYHGPNNPFTS